MEEQLIKKKNTLEILELVAIVGSFGGSIAALVMNSTAAIASFPLSVCLALNFASRKDLRREMKLYDETTLFQLTQQINSLQEKTTNSLEEITVTQNQLCKDVSQNKQELETAINSLQQKLQQSDKTIAHICDIAIATQAISRDFNATEYYCQRGYSYENLGDKQGAIQDYTKAIEIDPTCAKALNHRGLIYMTLGDRKTAVEDLRRAAKFYFDRGDLVEYQKARDLSQELYEVDSEEPAEEEQVVLKGFMS
jgi:tetratricopeptide (TPR) repeat protein